MSNTFSAAPCAVSLVFLFPSGSNATFESYKAISDFDDDFNIDNSYCSISLSEQQQNSYAKLELISNLKDNWNGNNALAFSSELISKCRKLVQHLPYQPEIFPTAVGAIQFEYKSANAYLEFEISEDTINEYRVYSDNSDIENKDISFEEMEKEVVDFYG